MIEDSKVGRKTEGVWWRPPYNYHPIFVPQEAWKTEQSKFKPSGTMEMGVYTKTDDGKVVFKPIGEAPSTS